MIPSLPAGPPGNAQHCGREYFSSMPHAARWSLILELDVYKRQLLPMVSTRDEFEHALDAVYRAKCALRERGVPFAETVPVLSLIHI